MAATAKLTVTVTVQIMSPGVLEPGDHPQTSAVLKAQRLKGKCAQRASLKLPNLSQLWPKQNTGFKGEIPVLFIFKFYLILKRRDLETNFGKLYRYFL